MADILPQDRLNEGIGMFGISGLIGIAIGPILAEIMLEHFGFAGLFIVAGILSGISLIIHQPLKESAPTGEEECDLTTFFGLFRREKFIVVGLISLLFGVGLAGSGNFVAPLAEERNLGFISAYFFCYSGGAITIRFVNGWLSGKFGENRILPCSIVLYMAGLLLLPLAYNQEVLCVAGILSGIGHGLLFPLLNTMAVRDESASIRGKATGIFTGGIDSGIFAGSLILGYIGDWFGLNVLFLCAGLSMTIALIIFRFRRPDSCN
jgi:MFS family permease